MCGSEVFFSWLSSKVPPILLDKQFSDFTPDITPIILAAHTNNYEIIKLLVQKGVSMPQPHEVSKACHLRVMMYLLCIHWYTVHLCGLWCLNAHELKMSWCVVYSEMFSYYLQMLQYAADVINSVWDRTQSPVWTQEGLIKMCPCFVWCSRCAATVSSVCPARTWTACGTRALASTSTKRCRAPR